MIQKTLIQPMQSPAQSLEPGGNPLVWLESGSSRRVRCIAEDGTETLEKPADFCQSILNRIRDDFDRKMSEQEGEVAVAKPKEEPREYEWTPVINDLREALMEGNQLIDVLRLVQSSNILRVTAVPRGTEDVVTELENASLRLNSKLNCLNHWSARLLEKSQKVECLRLKRRNFLMDLKELRRNWRLRWVPPVGLATSSGEVMVMFGFGEGSKLPPQELPVVMDSETGHASILGLPRRSTSQVLVISTEVPHRNLACVGVAEETEQNFSVGRLTGEAGYQGVVLREPPVHIGPAPIERFLTQLQSEALDFELFNRLSLDASRVDVKTNGGSLDGDCRVLHVLEHELKIEVGRAVCTITLVDNQVRVDESPPTDIRPLEFPEGISSLSKELKLACLRALGIILRGGKLPSSAPSLLQFLIICCKHEILRESVETFLRAIRRTFSAVSFVARSDSAVGLAIPFANQTAVPFVHYVVSVGDNLRIPFAIQEAELFLSSSDHVMPFDWCQKATNASGRTTPAGTPIAADASHEPFVSAYELLFEAVRTTHSAPSYPTSFFRFVLVGLWEDMLLSLHQEARRQGFQSLVLPPGTPLLRTLRSLFQGVSSLLLRGSGPPIVCGLHLLSVSSFVCVMYPTTGRIQSLEALAGKAGAADASAERLVPLHDAPNRDARIALLMSFLLSE